MNFIRTLLGLKRGVGEDSIVSKLQKLNINLERSTCNVCLEVEHIVKLSCDHNMCVQCLATLFRKSCSDYSLMPPKCCQLEIDCHLADHLLNKKEATLFLRKYIEATTENKCYCPNKKCSTLILLDYVNSRIGIFSCTACRTVICSDCKNEFHIGPCNDQNDTEFQRVIQSNNWKTCARCRRVIELGTGCNHITCVCGYEFCYVCGDRWITTPCRNGCILWEENRLTEDLAAREPNVELRVAVRENLVREGCGLRHPWQRVNNGGLRCMNCGFHMWVYHFQCRDCRFRACYTCTHHRMIR